MPKEMPTRPPGGTNTQRDLDAPKSANVVHEQNLPPRPTGNGQPGPLPPENGKGISGRGGAHESDEQKQERALRQPGGSHGGRPEKQP